MRKGRTILIQIRLPIKLVEKMDRLIKLGYYSSRSEFISDLIRSLDERKFSDELALYIENYLNGRIKKERDLKLRVEINIEDVRRKFKEIFGTDDISKILDWVRGRVP
mgnify:CR=1 FL=1